MGEAGGRGDEAMGARALGILAVLAGAVLWGSTGTVQALLPEAREPVVVGALRLIIGAAALGLAAAAAAESRAAFARLPRGAVLLAGAAIGAYNLLFFMAVSLAGVGVGTAVAIGSGPLWATAYETLALRRPPGLARAAALGCAVAGVAILGAAGGGAGGSALGVALALGAGACYATYSLATSAVSGRAPAATVAAATFAVAALVAAPALLVAPTAWLAAPESWAETWAALLFLGVGATGVSYALYTWGLARVAASTAVTLALIEPVTAWALAVAVVGESVTLPGAVGAGLILLGLLGVAITPARPPAPAA